MIEKSSIHPFLILPPLFLYFCRRYTAAKPSFFGGWHRAVLAMIMYFFPFDLGGGGGRDDRKIIHPSIFDLGSPALAFLCRRYAVVAPSFFDRWQRAALVMMVSFVLYLIWVEVEGAKIKKSIHQIISSLPSYSDSLAATLPLSIPVLLVDGTLQR